MRAGVGRAEWPVLEREGTTRRRHHLVRRIRRHFHLVRLRRLALVRPGPDLLSQTLSTPHDNEHQQHDSQDPTKNSNRCGVHMPLAGRIARPTSDLKRLRNADLQPI